jgi:hypothetical protein
VFSCMVVISLIPISINFATRRSGVGDFHQVDNLLDHAAHGRSINVKNTPEAKTPQALPVLFKGANGAFHLSDFYFFLCHGTSLAAFYKYLLIQFSYLWVTRSLFKDFRDGLATLGCHVFRSAHVLQTLEGRTHHVYRVG